MTRPRGVRALVGLALILATACSGPKDASGRSPPPADSPTSPAAPSPSPEPELVFAVKGDWGDGTAVQRQITDRMCRVRRSDLFADVLTTGDNFYAPDGVATRGNYRGPERCLIEESGHRWRATWGNHDVRGSSTRTVLGARRWYRWSAGGVDFLMLDSNDPSSRRQLQFMRQTLKGSRARVKIVVFHHPPFTVGRAHRDHPVVKHVWVPMFERFGVSLVLTGHSHNFEHHRVRGIDYVVTGGGGRYLHGCRSTTRPSLRICRTEHHFLLVRVRGPAITVRAIDRTGTTFERISIET